MEEGNIVCPVCSLFLREGITLKSHLGTHPKEKVIEALLKATGDTTPASQTSVQSVATTPVQAYLPTTTYGSTASAGATYVNQNHQYVSPQSQMTAVTYQHIMTSNGAAVMPQYIQVPAIVAPNTAIPILPQQPFNYVPSANGAYSQTIYNPLYNPFIPQPYPVPQAVSQPVITSFPIPDLQSSDGNTQNTSSQISVISNTPFTNSFQVQSLAKDRDPSQRCTIATNTVSVTEEMDLSDCKSEDTLSEPPSPRPERPGKGGDKAFRVVGKLTRQSKPLSNGVSVVTVSKVSSKTSVITTAKPKVKVIPLEKRYSSYSSSSSSSSGLSPPPLTLSLINRSRSSSISCPTPTPPPLVPAPTLVLPDVVVKDEDRPGSTSVSPEDELLSASKVHDFLKNQNSVNSVIVESNVTTYQCTESFATGQDQADDAAEGSEAMRGKGKGPVLDLASHDIPTEISSANIERNCDGSDIFIQEENIPFSEPCNEGRRKLGKATPNVDTVDGFSLFGTEAPVDPFAEVPKYSDLQPATYTDLQPASGPQVLHNMGLSSPLNFNNYMEIDGIRIFFSNNSPATAPLAPTVKFSYKNVDKSSVHSVHDYFTTEGSEDKESLGSVIQVAAQGSSEAGIEKHLATTSRKNNDTLSPLTLNIQADESMPARGELSEQESLGADNSNWGLYREEPRDWKPSLAGPPVEAVEAVESMEPAPTGTRKSFKCSLCNDRFSCPKERRVHKNTAHLDHISRPLKTERELSRKLKTFKCTQCEEVFTSVRERRIHIIGQHSLEEKKGETIKKEVSENLDKYFVNVDKLMSESGVIKQEGDANVKTEAGTAELGVDSSLVSRRCPRCPRTLGSLRKLREHLREVHGDVKFQCGTCSACFDDESEYNGHLKVHPLVCHQCGKVFYRKPNLNLHLKRHLETKPYECSLCPKSFITRQKLEEHMNGHSGNRPIKCTLCDRSFSRHSNLIQHRNMHHLKVKRKIKDYVCRCGEVFHSLRKLEWHKEVHEPKPKTCPFCAQKFIHSASVTRHVRRAHMPDYLPGDNREYENVQCPICDRIYLRSSLIVHMRVHNGEKPFVCQICSKRFSTKWNLELHNWTHQSRSSMPFKCTTCKSAFFRESDYIAHLNSHKNFKPFTCNICGQKFIRKYNCLRHQEEHKRAKKFACTVSGCDKSFHRSYYLKDHMKVHTGVRPHTCHVCGKASSTKSNHNKHVRIHDTREPINTEN